MVTVETLYREFSDFVARRLLEVKEQMGKARGDQLTYLRGVDHALYQCRLRFEGLAKGHVSDILTLSAPVRNVREEE